MVRFVDVLREYRIGRVNGDCYAGETFRADFEGEGITYVPLTRTKSEGYEAFEPLLSGRRVVPAA